MKTNKKELACISELSVTEMKEIQGGNAIRIIINGKEIIIHL